MKKLYHLRWGIESSFRKLKYDLGCIQFHSKQDNFIEMEIYAHMIMFNTVRLMFKLMCHNDIASMLIS